MKGLAHPPWRLEEITQANAALVLPELAASFLSNGDKAVREETSEAKLHAFRLNTKEFRYTLEAFRPLYGPALDRHIANVRKVQTVLGDFNDCRATGDLLGRFEAVAAIEVEQLRQYLEARKAELRRKFVEMWSALYGTERQRQVLARYLRRPVAGGVAADL
ncbi:MAG: CHAD domain-containing protein [Acidobacteriota bacterium]